MSIVSINPVITSMIRKSPDWCPLCNHLEVSCICSTDQPLRENSSVLQFVRAPNRPGVGVCILRRAADYLYARYPMDGGGDTNAVDRLDAMREDFYQII